MKKVSVLVRVGAREERVEPVGEGVLRVSVRERPERGLANEAVAALVARHFRVPRSAVSFVVGRRSRSKVLSIRF